MLIYRFIYDRYYGKNQEYMHPDKQELIIKSDETINENLVFDYLSNLYKDKIYKIVIINAYYENTDSFLSYDSIVKELELNNNKFLF